MKQRYTAVLCFLAALAMLFSGCNTSGRDKKLDFITFYHDAMTMTGQGGESLGTEQKGYIWVGETRDELSNVLGVGFSSLYAGVWCKYDDTDGTSISMMIDQKTKTSMYGTSIESNYADLIPAYSKDPTIKVLLDTKEKVIFGKQIDGVNYTVTYRNYATSGDVKTITITNTDKYTESDDDYPEYK